jgi:signal transduction histidine kinase
MVQQSGELEKAGLQFFGKMSAANAHEIKNALAVINENAGLLEDLTVVAERGVPLDLQRLKRVATVIKQQVARADHIAKSSNRFSHSVDSCHESADLKRSLILVADMATRFANLRDVDLHVATEQATITLHVRPFTLLHLLWLCLHAAIKACKPGQVLKIASVKIGGITKVRYGPVAKPVAALMAELRAMPEMDSLLQSMDSSLQMDPDTAALQLTFDN